jgi:hypothetical protein
MFQFGSSVAHDGAPPRLRQPPAFSTTSDALTGFSNALTSNGFPTPEQLKANAHGSTLRVVRGLQVRVTFGSIGWSHWTFRSATRKEPKRLRA